MENRFFFSLCSDKLSEKSAYEKRGKGKDKELFSSQKRQVRKWIGNRLYVQTYEKEGERINFRGTYKKRGGTCKF